MILVGMWSVCSTEQQEQELITLPKNKKKYVSKEQCIDAIGESVVMSNTVNKSLNALRQTIDTIQAEDLTVLGDYADGQKDCFLNQAGKIELTRYYEKIMKLNQELEHCNHEIQKIQQCLEHLNQETRK